jgi:hypothetical protein
MPDIDKAVQSQLANIQKRTGKSTEDLFGILDACGLAKHGERVAYLKDKLGMGHGDANLIVHLCKQAEQSAPEPSGEIEDPLDRLYQGKKLPLKPIHEALLQKMRDLGDCETAPKKTYVSYRRKKQFAMIGPATNTRVELGLNAKNLTPTDRLEQLPPGKMCQFLVKITDPSQVDDELAGWIKTAYLSSG